MLSYRHAFHAGNHADVLKHLVLIELTRYLGQKDKPFWVVDTHAGAGAYALDSAHASKLAEYREGVGRLWERKDHPPAVADYMALVRRLNPSGGLKVYPGSPFFALWTLREQDRLKERLLDIMATHRLDALVFPHQQRLVVKIDESQVERNGVLASVTGFPSITIPAGFSVPSATAPLGVPIGIEFLGRPWSERTLIGLAGALEQAMPVRKAPIL